MTRPLTTYGVVVIGRNEGERLRRCLQSLASPRAPVVYVDSGSRDGSVTLARALGAAVVCLDPNQPFTAARARNAGLDYLRAACPGLDYVQFVDGDCEVDGAWLPKALRFLQAHPDVAVVCGRRRERHPERSFYNLLCDVEWNTPTGEAAACGGDALMRRAALDQVGGYRPDLIAGEEPELCVRLRSLGWRVWRLDCEMTRHDAAMTRFGQWWRRTVRAGHAYAEGAGLHGGSSARHFVRESRRAWAWGLGLPAATLLAAALHPAGWGLALLYPAQVVRLAWRDDGQVPARWRRALFLVLGKFAEAQGQLGYLRHRLARRRTPLIEYK